MGFGLVLEGQSGKESDLAEGIFRLDENGVGHGPPVGGEAGL